jgi:hypothetical protein
MVIEHQIVVWTTRNGAYAFDATAHQWKRSRLSPTRTSYVGKVVRAGTSLLFPGGYYEASGHPTMPPGPGAQYFLRTGASREIAPAVIDLPGTVYVWTGARLLGTYQGAARGFGSKVESGTTAAWNPHTNTWTRLKRSPAITQLGTWAWTGKELIGWGPNTRAGHRYDGMIFGPR